MNVIGTAVLVMMCFGALPVFAQEPEKDQAVSPEDLEKLGLELDAAADIETRGLTHTGTIAEIHHNRVQWQDNYRQTCIKMNPSIPGATPWACLYSHTIDPTLSATLGFPSSRDQARKQYGAFEGSNEIRRLLHDAYIHNKRCKIWYVGPAGGRLNGIMNLSCYNP